MPAASKNSLAEVIAFRAECVDSPSFCHSSEVRLYISMMGSRLQVPTEMPSCFGGSYF